MRWSLGGAGVGGVDRRGQRGWRGTRGKRRKEERYLGGAQEDNENTRVEKEGSAGWLLETGKRAWPQTQTRGNGQSAAQGSS